MVVGRSPAYPYIDLAKAVGNAKKIHSFAKGHSVDVEGLFKQLGFNGMTGSARKTLAAMKYYGLVEQAHGSKEAKLSANTMHIIHGVEGSKEQKDAIKEAFLSPPIYEYCWDTWGDDDIDAALMKSHLILKKGFNDSTVMGFISNYKLSRNFANIAQNDHLDGDEEDSCLQAKGYGTSMPIDEVTIGNAPEDTGNLPPQLTVDVIPPPVGVGMRQETFTLSEGEILIQFPSSMTSDDFEDFEDWLNILKRKVKRNIKTGQISENNE